MQCPECKSENIKIDAWEGDMTKGLVGGAATGSIVPGVGTMIGGVIGMIGGIGVTVIHGRLFVCQNCKTKWRGRL